MSFLFEEEEIVEEVQSSPKIIQPSKPIEVKEEEPKIETPILDKPKSIFVDFDESQTQPEVNRIKKTTEVQSKTIEQPTSRPRRRDSEPLEYEFSSTISPIFGRKEEKDKPVITVQPKIELETSQSILGTIISPIYGIKSGNRPVKKVEKIVPVSTNMSLEDILGVTPNQEETVTQLSLQQEDETESLEKEDILMQLFEEDTD